jgi:transcriptional regulator with XRE-family HTH domain
MPPERSNEPLAIQLPHLMRDRGISTTRLAREVGVNQSHLSRVLRGANRKTVSGELAERIAVELGLPSDWFPETRQARLFAVLRADDVLRDRLYDELVRRAPPPQA